MLQIKLHKFNCRKCPASIFVCLSIPIPERHLFAIVLDNPVVADKAALRVGGQIFERVFAVANTLEIDDVFLAKNIPPDLFRSGKLPDRRVEFSPEQPHQRSFREQEIPPFGKVPNVAVRGQRSARQQRVNMRMKIPVATPRLIHHHESDHAMEFGFSYFQQ